VLDVPALIDRITGRGVRPSVSDHISRDVTGAVDSIDAVRAYLDELERYDVARAGEFCWHDALWRELPPSTVRRFSHRVGSLHSIRLANGQWFRAFSHDLPPALTPAAYMEAHIESLEAMAKEMAVDILAHPTLVPPPMRRMDPHELWSERHESRAVEALKQAGIALEISARYPPHERLVRRAADAGVRLALGSDGHAPEQVANVTAPLAMARRIGVADPALYDPTRHGSRTGAFDR
jgi:hypothetical protein